VESDGQKIPFSEWVVKEKIALENSLGFQAQIDDLGLKSTPSDKIFSTEEINKEHPNILEVVPIY
jgi:hypothetical protein